MKTALKKKITAYMLFHQKKMKNHLANKISFLNQVDYRIVKE